MQEFSFKPAPVRKTQTWAVKDGHLMRRGAPNALKLANVTSASWNTVSYRGTRSAWLHLNTDDATTKIEYTDHGGSRDAFVGLIQAVSASLKEVNPDLEIKYGYSPPWRTALFVLGLAGTVLGLFLVFAGLTNMTGKGAVEATIAGAALTILLLPVAWTCRPNVRAATFGPDGLADEVGTFRSTPMFDPQNAPGEE
jgi:hypothetical protein